MKKLLAVLSVLSCIASHEPPYDWPRVNRVQAVQRSETDIAKWDEYAKVALQGLLVCDPPRTEMDENRIARRAAGIADNMMWQRFTRLQKRD